MSFVYSTYEAQARFSEVIRQVRDGKTVTVSYRGEPVAEIRAIRREPQTLEARLDELERQGIICVFRPRESAVHRAGATARGLEAVPRRAERMSVAYRADSFPGAARSRPRSRPLSTAGTPSAIHIGAGASSRWWSKNCCMRTAQSSWFGRRRRPCASPL